MDDFEELLKEKSYLIKSAIKKLNIYKDYEEFYHLGTIALFLATKEYDENKDNLNNFDVFAYYRILNYLRNELTMLTRYDKIEMCMDLYENDYLAPVIEADLIERIEFEDLLQYLPDQQKRILEYKKSGYKNDEICLLMNLSLEQVKYQTKLAFRTLRDILSKIKNN